MAIARQLLELGYARAAETSLLRLFYRYALLAGRVYDLTAELYRSVGRHEEADAWRLRKATMLGVAP